MRVPIEGGRGIGYILRPGFNLPPLMFSIEETEAIVLSLALLERTGDVELKQAAKRVNQKIAAAMPAPLRRRRLTPMRSTPGGRWRASPEGVDLAIVRRAIRDEQKLGDRLSRRTRPGDGTDDPADRADLLFGDGQYRRMVRIARRPCAISASTASRAAPLSTISFAAKAIFCERNGSPAGRSTRARKWIEGREWE